MPTRYISNLTKFCKKTQRPKRYWFHQAVENAVKMTEMTHGLMNYLDHQHLTNHKNHPKDQKALHLDLMIKYFDKIIHSPINEI